MNEIILEMRSLGQKFGKSSISEKSYLTRINNFFEG